MYTVPFRLTSITRCHSGRSGSMSRKALMAAMPALLTRTSMPSEVRLHRFHGPAHHPPIRDVALHEDVIPATLAERLGGRSSAVRVDVQDGDARPPLREGPADAPADAVAPPGDHHRLAGDVQWSRQIRDGQAHRRAGPLVGLIRPPPGRRSFLRQFLLVGRSRAGREVEDGSPHLVDDQGTVVHALGHEDESTSS